MFLKIQLAYKRMNFFMNNNICLYDDAFMTVATFVIYYFNGVKTFYK